MAEVLGLGVTHYPGLMVPNAQMATVLTKTLESDRVPAELFNSSKCFAIFRP